MRISYEGKEYWADSAQLKQNEYQHERFEGEVKARIQLIMEKLSEVYPLTCEEWEDGFRRDQNPLNEISIWERIVAVYQSYSKDANELSMKKEIYSIVVTCSFSEPNQVLNQLTLEKLSQAKAMEIICAYHQKT